MRVAEIRPALRALGRTQAELAAHLGLSHNHISQLLSGKRRMSVDVMRAIETFLRKSGRDALSRGVAETPAVFARAPQARSLTLEEARALKDNPPPKPSREEQDRLVRDLKELSDAYKRLVSSSDTSDDEILGYDESGIPSP